MRRVALAGVLAMQPSFLILDEPTAGLDPSARDFLLNDIKQLNDEGTTVVLISHAMDDVAKLATRVAVLEKGRLVMEGAPEEIFIQQDKLSHMGLDIPESYKLQKRLSDLGLDLPPINNLNDLADELAKRLLGGDDDAA